MNKVMITLLTNTQNELNRFLSTYFTKEMNINEKAFKWSCIYSNPLESIELLAAIIDNKEKYNIEVVFTYNNENIKISEGNLEYIIRFLYYRYV